MKKEKKKVIVVDRFENVRQPFKRWLAIESSGGIILIFATIAALIIANSGLGNAYEAFWKIDFMVGTEFLILPNQLYYGLTMV